MINIANIMKLVVGSCVIATLVFAATSTVLAQGNGTINGRVVDTSGAVVTGATVMATNKGTGLPRNTVTNSDGLYSFPALDSGAYDIRVEMVGFAPSSKNGVTLVVGLTNTVDFALDVAGVNQSVEVSGEAVQVQTTQSQVTASIQATQVQNLPLINRNFTGLVQLLPGARPVTPNISQQQQGNFSFSGGSFNQEGINVDGAENRNYLIGGPLQNYTTESVEEFTVMQHEFSAQYGHTATSVLNVVTKSGTNSYHGTAFGTGRSDALTAIDYFTKSSGLPKNSYNREHFGGSFGGPIVKDKVFFFVALEHPILSQALTIPTATYDKMVALQTLAVLVPGLGTVVVPNHSIPQTYHDWLSTAKVNWHINDAHSLNIRFAGERSESTNILNASLLANHDLSAPTIQDKDNWSVVGNWTWIISPTKLNQVTFERHHQWDNTDAATPFSPPLIASLIFPSFATGRASETVKQEDFEDVEQLKDDFSIDSGKHSFRVGFLAQYLSTFAVRTTIGAPGAISFFNDPDTILSSYQQWQANPSTCTTATCGVYPQGLSSIGAVSNITATSSVNADSFLPSASTEGVYFQDDWKFKPRLTLNLGLRYDWSFNMYNQALNHSRVYQIFNQIAATTGAQLPPDGLVKNPFKDVQPRVGFAWDMAGNGKHVLRGGFGIFFNTGLILNSWQAQQLADPTMFLISAFANTGTPGAPAAGFFGAPTPYRYGVTALPPVNPAPSTLSPTGNVTGYWQNPSETDPYSEQFHIGYAHQISSKTSIEVDFSHILAIHQPYVTEGNPVEGAWDPNAAAYNTCGAPAGARRYYCAFRAIGMASTTSSAAVLSTMPTYASINRGRYDELAVQFKQRIKSSALYVNYAYSRDYTYLTAQNQDNLISPINWGPNANDQPHWLSVFGVISLPKGIQYSPILQFASARPYTLTQGVDLNHDGTNNDRYLPCGDPTACSVVGPDSQRGKALFLIDMRATKFFNLGKEGARRLGIYIELYNLTNRANFGSSFNGSCSGKLVGAVYTCSNTNFETPNGYLPGLGYTRQMQLGARYIF